MRLLLVCTCLLLSHAADAASNFTPFKGFIDLFWSETDGKLFLKIEEFDAPFLYQTSLPRGLGSNDIGLDRGQLGATRVVKFIRRGPKVLLLEPNLHYRALGENAEEVAAVEQSFASSVIWGFTVESEEGDAVLVDATDFVLRDAHGVSQRLQQLGEGSYSVDSSRSAVFLPRTKAFPDNTEVEATVTFTGTPTGRYLPTVAPDPRALTVHMHHSFIRLPDDDYEPLAYDPRAGVIGLRYGAAGFADYASEIGTPLHVNYGIRHRLEKKDPTAAISEAVEPIVYYLDPGAPEPVKGALLDGARWWNQAFTAAGYRDAFRVEVLPDGADPMDVRYNVIQWVHRSTRGWSYGSSVIDPRTGEILKGHVSLGSLRVRQDYLIAEGLLAPYAEDQESDAMLEMSLARIRQLSAHEVGHTIGFTHNFAASTQDRASVMDYPFPLIQFDAQGELDLGNAYDDKIGSWDIRTVLYAYQDFPDDVDAAAARLDILRETIAKGFAYVADQDSRSIGASHPDGNLWDNGADAIAELEHLLKVRKKALANFSRANIRTGRPLATLEETLVPIYLLHRFQIEAVGKLLGGSAYHYALKGDGQPLPAPVPVARQRAALDALLATLATERLVLSDKLLALIPPRPPGMPKTRESFASYTGASFDALAPANAATLLTLEVLLHPERAARMQRQSGLGFVDVVEALLGATWFDADSTDIGRQKELLTLHRLLALSFDHAAEPQVRAIALDGVRQIERIVTRSGPKDRTTRAHYGFAAEQIRLVLDDPSRLESIRLPSPPPGSPIGSGDVFNPRL